jgi:NADH dehydrogenase
MSFNYTLPNLPINNKKRIVIIGGGFAGLKLANELANSKFQVVVIDKNNFHQFQPLLYQVATAGLEPSSIAFPIRKIFQKIKNVHFRLCELSRVVAEENYIETSIGNLSYDHLVIATGVNTNYFGNANLEKFCIPMKSVGESIYLRNTILTNFEKAMNTSSDEEMQSLLDFVVVGGGPTGTELSGALAEIRAHVMKKEYPEMAYNEMKITLIEAGPKLLGGFTDKASEKSLEYLTKLGVKVLLNIAVKDYDGHKIILSNGESFKTRNVIWAAGVKGRPIEGLPSESYNRATRLIVNNISKVIGSNNIYAIGDTCIMESEEYPKGHPQVAQVAIQQAKNLATNLKKGIEKPFKYRDYGSLATIGRNKAVADLPQFKTQGFFAWVMWLFVHVFQIIGLKNKLFIFLNWAWSYVTYDQSLRLLIKPFSPKE